MSIDQIVAEALRLPAKERALLAESLWESLEDPYLAEDPTGDSEGASLAHKRDCLMEHGQVAPLSHEDLMARLRS